MHAELIMDGSTSASINRPNPPATIRSGDIETILQWAMAQGRYTSWRLPDARELAMDHGWTCIPKGVSRAYHGGGIVLTRPVLADAGRVFDAVMALPDADTIKMVIACARAGVRPDCLLGIEPRQVEEVVYGVRKVGRRNRRRGRKTTIMVWKPSPEAICAARAAYTRWHGAIDRLIGTLRSELTHWRITGFSAPAAPWDQGLEKSA